MPAFTASQAKVDNGSKVVQINSGESVSNVRGGDFLVIANAIVEINRAYIGADNKGYFELVKTWPNSSQLNQPCIVIPTTAEFKTVIAALNEANTLVNNNYKAMQDWQTKTGTVTFSNKDGTTTTVKTLKQIEADNAAQLDAYHPYPWAMRKVEFEARRAANNEKYAASGFVHKGKTNTGGAIKKINEGAQVTEGVPTSLSGYIGLGAPTSAASNDISKTRHPVINIAGVITDLLSLSAPDDSYPVIVKLPSAEDGTRTYDSATGVSVTHATSAIAFASETATNKVVTDRVDMWGLEGFLREINDGDPFVYKNGLIQSQAPDINGVGTVLDNVRPITYFAWYEGDTTSRGKGVNWKTATESQRIAIASDPENNIYFDDETGKFYQWCVRGRSFAGLGNGDWRLLEDYESVDAVRFGGASTYIRLQGKRDVPESEGGDNGRIAYFKGSANHPLKGVSTIGLSGSKSSSLSASEECYFLICGTVSRLNQGAHHPSFNPLGASTFRSSANLGHRKWNHADISGNVLDTQTCFSTTPGALGRDINDGSIASNFSGREDGRYYDAVYASGQGGVCRDMRYKASGQTDVDFAEADLSIKDGTYRGREYVTLTKVHDLGSVLTSGSWDNGQKRLISFQGNIFDTSESQVYFVDGYILSKADNTKRKVLQVGYSPSVDRTNVYLDGDLSATWTADSYLIYSIETNNSIADEYHNLEVIGEPSSLLLCEDLKNGWVGTWNPEIPEGVVKPYHLCRPASNSSMTKIQTSDNGSSWALSNIVADQITNDYTSSSIGSSHVAIIIYKTKAKVVRDAYNDKTYGGELAIGDLFVSSFYGEKYGRLLQYSTIGKVPVSSLANQYENLSITRATIDTSLGKIHKLYPVNHTPLGIVAPNNNSPAFKALNYNVVENQQAFINYAYTELKHNGTDWGDDGKVHIADNQTTMLDENGNTVLVGAARCVEALGWIKNDK